ncbi:ATP-binding protein [Aphanothece hegewaldii CCALA 016]|uniref:ATP-binding protein n=1 Tax=Aphanothece hegewaldii CCALA 016 TaxID=2107694 RepID=A0A2T1LU35_9CHRO|nr:ATP-binding protein [Aphanothece hegewaldii]PSF34941.1 ATP-binding protein [Aphanothece hegewaldii CCALA 016]
MEKLLDRINTEDFSTTIVLGGPGFGKSSLLGVLGHSLVEQDYTLLAIKADYLSNQVKTLDDLQKDDQLRLSMNPIEAVKAVANKERVILLIDQLDAISELLDRNPERLKVLLTLIQSLTKTPNVHIIASCREFEFHHGSQFTRLEGFEQLYLSLPTWETIAAILEQAGHAPNSIGESLQELLRNPLHLKLFLEVAKPGEVFDSSQKLLNKLWDVRISQLPKAEKAREFLEKLAKQMQKEEVLWLPPSVADDYLEIYRALEQEGILITNPDNFTLGFCHQTYYDHTLARAFVCETQSLTDFVLERQDGLFVRPALLRSLNYLRGMAPNQYERELKKLFASSIRTHIRSLLIEFMGSQSQPNSVEKQLLIPLLNSETDGIKVLDAMNGSHGWFAHLRHRQEFTQWLEKLPEKAIYCRSLLFIATQFASEEVWYLLEEYWLDNPEYDALSLWIIREIYEWTPERVCLTQKAIQRSNLDWYEVKFIAERVAETLPELAPRILLAHLNWRLEQATEKHNQAIAELSAEPDEATSSFRAYKSIRLEPIRNLLENDHDFYELETFAETLPEYFLKTIWPWFTNLSEQIANENDSLETRYRDSHLSFYRGDIIKALQVAIAELANQDLTEFLNFFNQNVSIEKSDLLLVHRLLAQGLEKIASQAPQNVLVYLIGDSRRLSLGDGLKSYHRESKQLIAAVCPYLSPQDRQQIEQIIYQFNYYNLSPELSAEDRPHFIRSNREHRLELLLAFPDEYLSHQGKKIKEEELRAFPWVVERTKEGYNLTRPTIIGPRMTVDEMKYASDKELLNLFNELSDTTDEANIHQKKSIDLARSGGVREQTSVYGKLVKDDHERFLRMLPHFKPQRHEHYAGAAIRELAQTNFSAQSLIGIIKNLDRQGFNSEQFQDDAASALEDIAKSNKGLPQSVLSLLINWLSTHTKPKLENYQSKNQDHSHNNSIIFRFSNSHYLTNGRAAIVRAITSGYLQQNPPDLVNWASFIQSQIGIEKHPSVWIDIVTNMPLLLNGDRVKATRLFDLVIRNCPEVLSSEWSLCFISRTIGWFEPKETVHAWLEMFLQENSSFHYQAYGELLFIYNFHYQDEWSEDRIKEHLDRLDNEAILCGFAHASCHLWSDRICRKIATRILCSLATYSSPFIENTLTHFFRLNRDHFQLNREMRELIEAFCDRPTILVKAAYDLIEIIELENIIDTEPKLIIQICQSLLKQAQLEPKNYNLAHVADSFTTFAIQLHRQADYKEIGLQMFEKLLTLNLMETKVALETLDRKPTRFYISSRKRLRRQRTPRGKV